MINNALKLQIEQLNLCENAPIFSNDKKCILNNNKCIEVDKNSEHNKEDEIENSEKKKEMKVVEKKIKLKIIKKKEVIKKVKQRKKKEINNQINFGKENKGDGEKEKENKINN